jgi:tetratricopeptide (TPR) repeat protein
MRTGIFSIPIIPAAVIGGLALAAAGGFYVWREISAPPMMKNANEVAPSAPVTPQPAPAPAVLQPAISHTPQGVADRWERPPGRDEDYRGREAAPTQAGLAVSLVSAVAPVSPVRIEHSEGNDTVAPDLRAAWQAYHSGDFDIAAQRYGTVLRTDARNRDALLGMAAIAQQQAQDGVAAQYYTVLLALDPRDPLAHAGMSALPGAATATDTESRLKILLAHHPEAAALYFALGNRYAEQARWGDAQQAYFNSYTLEPDSAQSAFNLAVSLDHLGHAKLAAQHYRQALQLDSAGHAGFDRALAQLRAGELSNQ